MKKAKIGFLPLYIKLYDDRSKHLRPEMEKYRAALADSLRNAGLEVVEAEICRIAPEFAAALSNVDRLVLLDIYPAREEPIPGVTSEIIFNDAQASSKILIKKEELLDWVKEQTLEGKELFMTLGAGDIDRLVGPIAEILTEKLNRR